MNKKDKYQHIVYIDESNILSKTGNTVYVCLYIVITEESIASKYIIDIEENLKISHTHWVDMPWKLRKKFAEKIQYLDFVCKALVYNNPIMEEDTFREFLHKTIKNEDKIYKIVIDGQKSKKYENELKTILKDKGLKFHKIKFMNDKKEPLIRLTDFMAGFCRSYVDDKNDHNVYIHNLLKHKIKTPD